MGNLADVLMNGSNTNASFSVEKGILYNHLHRKDENIMLVRGTHTEPGENQN